MDKEKINKIAKWIGLLILGWLIGSALDYFSLTYLSIIWVFAFPVIIFSILLKLLKKEKIEDVKIILIILIMQALLEMIARLI